MKELKYEYEKKWREDQCSLFRFCGDFPVLVELDAAEVDAVGWLLEDGARDACGVLGYAVLLCDESSVSDTVTSTSMGGSFGRIAGLVEGEALDAELSSSTSSSAELSSVFRGFCSCTRACLLMLLCTLKRRPQPG